MVTDSKKAALESLVIKIKTYQDFIAEQTIISSIDIDILLDYIRTLYEHYVSLKQELTLKEKTETKPEFPESGTLPFFDNSHNEVTNYELQVRENEEENVVENENENEDDFLLDDEELFENMEDYENETDESEENEENVAKGEEDEIEDEDLEDDDEKAAKYRIQNAENEEDEIEDEDLDDEDEYTENFEEEPFAAFPEMEIETNLSVSGIDIDTIEFEEEEDNDDEPNTESNTNEIPIPHIGTSGQPRYWGDELDIEPTPAKPISLGNQYISNKPSLNEIVSGFKPDESIGLKLQHASVSDLMKSIDMNLKFLFVKNLFKGNGSAFTEEINRINSIGKLHDAIKYVDEIRNKYNWDDKSEAYTELYKLVLRKYAR